MVVLTVFGQPTVNVSHEELVRVACRRDGFYLAAKLAEAILVRIDCLDVVCCGHQQLTGLLQVAQLLQLLELRDNFSLVVEGGDLVEGKLCRS